MLWTLDAFIKVYESLVTTGSDPNYDKSKYTPKEYQKLRDKIIYLYNERTESDENGNQINFIQYIKKVFNIDIENINKDVQATKSYIIEKYAKPQYFFPGIPDMKSIFLPFVFNLMMWIFKKLGELEFSRYGTKFAF